MKKLFLIIGIFSIFMAGCSTIDNEKSKVIESVIANFFNDVNNIKDYTNESELGELNSYFTDNSDVKGNLVEHLTASQLKNEKQMVNYIVKETKINKQDDLYKVTVTVDVNSKETNSLLFPTDMNFYFKEENDQMKIETADYGG